MRKAAKAWPVDRILRLPKRVTEECLFFSAGLLKLNFNDTLVSSTHTFPVNIFNLEGGETMLARDKGSFHAQNPTDPGTLGPRVFHRPRRPVTPHPGPVLSIKRYDNN